MVGDLERELGEQLLWAEKGKSISIADGPEGSDGDANVLLLADDGTADESRACAMLSSLSMADRWNAILVTYDETAQERLSTWREFLDEEPADLSVISVQDRVSSATVTATSEGETGSVSFRGVGDPSDLVRLGLTISQSLDEASDDGERSILCFHSITSLLQFVEVPRVFRFLYTLKHQIDRHDAVAHYHLDPTVLDEQTLVKIRSLFDEVVRVESDDH